MTIYEKETLIRIIMIIVDESDTGILRSHHWSIQRNRQSETYYVYRQVRTGGHRRKIYLHRELMGATAGYQVDHINGDGLDNRRINLRLCTNVENSYNRKPSSRSKTGLKGVYKTSRGKWAACCSSSGRTLHLGIYPTSVDAARAYDVYAVEHYGEFAWLNFPGAKL